MSQHLYEGFRTEQVNALLGGGAALVWIAAAQRRPVATSEGDTHWDVVLDHPEFSDEAGAVLAWLESVSPGVVDEAMLRGAKLSESPGTAALNALKQLAAGDGP